MTHNCVDWQGQTVQNIFSDIRLESNFSSTFLSHFPWNWNKLLIFIFFQICLLIIRQTISCNWILLVFFLIFICRPLISINVWEILNQEPWNAFKVLSVGDGAVTHCTIYIPVPIMWTVTLPSALSSNEMKCLNQQKNALTHDFPLPLWVCQAKQ